MTTDFAALWQQAEHLSGAGRHDLARPLYARLISDRGFAPLAHLRLAVLDRRNGDLRGATTQALAALAAAYADPDLMELLCKVLLTVGETRAALACADRLMGSQARLESCAEVGKMLSDHMLPEAALPLLRRAMALGLANSPAIRYLVGLNLMYLGRLAEAREELERSVAGDPSLAAAHWALSKLGPSDQRNQRVDRLRRQLAITQDGAHDAPLLWYSLFQELDASADGKAAWCALQRGLALRRAQVRFGETAQEALFAAAARGLALATRVAGRAAGQTSGPTPVFVVGMPRTGTTIIEQQLCEMFAVASAGELRDLTVQMRWITRIPGAYQFDQILLDALDENALALLGERYMAHAGWRAGGSRYFIDKWPDNYLAIGHILVAVPQARILCVRRSAVDTCFSNLKEWFGAGYYYSYDLAETARQYIRFDRLMGLVEAMCHPRVAFIEYEAFVRNPHAIAAKAGLELGLPRREESSGGPGPTIATASTVQARQTIDARRIGAWRRYQAHLQPVIELLAASGCSLEREDQQVPGHR